MFFTDEGEKEDISCVSWQLPSRHCQTSGVALSGGYCGAESDNWRSTCSRTGQELEAHQTRKMKRLHIKHWNYGLLLPQAPCHCLFMLPAHFPNTYHSDYIFRNLSLSCNWRWVPGNPVFTLFFYLQHPLLLESSQKIIFLGYRVLAHIQGWLYLPGEFIGSNWSFLGPIFTKGLLRKRSERNHAVVWPMGTSSSPILSVESAMYYSAVG